MSNVNNAVVCVGGLDTSGGSGLAADIRAAAALRTPCLPVAAALAPQDAGGVRQVFPVPPGALRGQLRAVDWSGVGAVKLGVVYLPELLELLLAELPRAAPLVIDPVLGASAGGRLAVPGLLEALRGRAFPRASLVTFNRREVQAFFDRDYVTVDEAAVSAGELAVELGCAVLLKGGHLPGAPVDCLATPAGAGEVFPGGRSRHAVRGTGCLLATAIACGLAAGLSVAEAAGRAKVLVNDAVSAAYAGAAGYVAAPGAVG